jgi:membrane-bound metal-dependent hydrolase YbcI (DUF457 family)
VKGITHFAIGVATASCFPDAVSTAAAGNPTPFLLGGIAGLLPDTLDFKFYKFLYKHDIEVTPDPLAPDAEMIANAVTLAIHRAWETRKPVRIKLNTIRLGADAWQRYFVRFDVAHRKVLVRYGPTVDTGQNVIGPAPTTGLTDAVVPLLCNVQLDYEEESLIDIFDGPAFEMQPTAARYVVPRFIPWHREWTHSVPVAFVAGLATALALNTTTGLIVFLAWTAHVVADQMGQMGSNWLYPFQSHRAPGWRWIRSASAVPNFTAVWTSGCLIFLTLYRQVHALPSLAFAKWLLALGLLPATLAWIWSRIEKSSSDRAIAEATRAPRPAKPRREVDTEP